MSSHLIQSLRDYGFSENEAEVYLFLLRSLESTAFAIATATRIPRTTVYSVLESLSASRFISSFRKNNVLYFTPESPNRLIHLLKEKEKIINDVLPDIRALGNGTGEVPMTRMYVGIEGLKIVHEDILETLERDGVKKLYAVAQEDIFDILPKYFPEWLKRRKAMGVFTELIVPESLRAGLHPLFKKDDGRDIRFMPDTFPLNCSLELYSDKMAVMSYRDGEIYSVIIESGTFTSLFRQFFLFTWSMLKE